MSVRYAQIIAGIVAVIAVAPILLYILLYMVNSMTMIMVQCRTKLTEIVRDEHGRIVQILEKCIS